jgi:hypothetical protein
MTSSAFGAYAAGLPCLGAGGDVDDAWLTRTVLPCPALLILARTTASARMLVCTSLARTHSSAIQLCHSIFSHCAIVPFTSSRLTEEQHPCGKAVINPSDAREMSEHILHGLEASLDRVKVHVSLALRKVAPIPLPAPAAQFSL